MIFIKNFDLLAINEGRKVVLEILEAGLEAIQPSQVINEQFLIKGDQLEVQGQRFSLKNYDRVFLLGSGKEFEQVLELIKGKLGDRLTSKLEVNNSAENLNQKDLVLTLIYGSESEFLDKFKNGGLAKVLFPATVISLIFSDLPGNNFLKIASGPTVFDPIGGEEEKYFKNVNNILMCSNLTAIQAMGRKAQELGFQVTVYSDRMVGNGEEVGKELVQAAKELGKHQVLLAGGKFESENISEEIVKSALGEIKAGQIIGVDQLTQMQPHNGKDLSKFEMKLEGVIVAAVDCEVSGAMGDENGEKIEIEKGAFNVGELMVVLKG